jgi:acyl-homoserine lactone acylase PvdQ
LGDFLPGGDQATTALLDTGGTGLRGSGPARRFVAEARHSNPKAVQVIPGGESGNPAGPWLGNQLGLWLTADFHEATTRRGDVDVALRLRFVSAS